MSSIDSHQPPSHTEHLSPEILSDTSPGPFEGPEKLLEVWFAPSPSELPAPVHTIGNGLKFRTRAGSDGVAEAEEGGGQEIVSGGQGDYTGLRRVPRHVWEEMLDVVKCKVLSVIEGEDIDAYLLSESSLFISPNLIILKTCGTTINLLGLTRIIEIAREWCGWGRVWRCFYSRKSFFFPERQVGPHRGWREEVDFLDAVFDHEGSAYTVGPMNGDHWLLYITSPSEDPPMTPKSLPAPIPMEEHLSSLSLTKGHPSVPNTTNAIQHSSLMTPPASLPVSIRTSIASNPNPLGQHQDQTLEILMTHLSPSARSPFFHPAHLDPSLSDPNNPEAPELSRSGHHLGQVLTTHLKIDDLFAKEETTIDAFGFEPCGYSANGIVGRGSSHVVEGDEGGEKGDGGYFTIHVTPEEGWSFASFECNVPLPLEGSTGEDAQTVARPDLVTLIRKVVDIFQPGRMSITLFLSTPPDPTAVFSDDESEVENPVTKRAWSTFSKDLLGASYTRKDRIGYEFDGYDLVFGCFEKKGFKGSKGPDAPAI